MDLKPKIDHSKYENVFTVVDSHTVGMPTRIIVGGMPELKGETMIDKKNDLLENYDHLRTALMLEPRGHRDMFGAILTEPVHDEAQFGILFTDSEGSVNMCGHGTIGAATVLINTGIIEAIEPVTHVVFDAPAGIIEVDVQVENGVAKSVSFTNVPAFVYKENLTTVIDGKEIKYDIAFGGNFYTLVDSKQLVDKIDHSTVRELIDWGMKILPQVNKEVDIKHPELDITVSDVCEFYGDAMSGGDYRNVVVFGQNQADRSPCGTGTCAKMSYFYKHGEMKVGDKVVNESFIGSKFIGEIIGTSKVGEFNAIIPRITGSAYVSACGEYLIQPDDPLKDGFLIG